MVADRLGLFNRQLRKRTRLSRHIFRGCRPGHGRVVGRRAEGIPLTFTNARRLSCDIHSRAIFTVMRYSQSCDIHNRYGSNHVPICRSGRTDSAVLPCVAWSCLGSIKPTAKASKTPSNNATDNFNRS